MAMTQNSSINEQPLRILRIASDIYPEQMGGGALHVHEMSKLQAQDGHKVTVITSDHGDSSLPSSEYRSGYKIQRDSELIKIFGNSITPNTIKRIRNLVSKFDVLHAHSHLYFTTNVAAIIRKLSNTPLIVTNHGLLSQTAPNIVQKIYFPTIAKWTLNVADCVLCYTNADRARLRERGIDSPISVIPNGIDCQLFSPKNTRRENQLLYVGRLKKSKGVKDLIHAFNHVEDYRRDASLKIVGDGPLREKLNNLCRKYNITDKVDLVGQVPNQDLPQVYANSSLFVLPSEAEGLPRTILESLACETPVVTTNLPQLKEVIRGCGCSVPVGAPRKLARTINYLLSNDELRQRLGHEGRRRVRNKHSWAKTVHETTKIYYRLLSESN